MKSTFRILFYVKKDKKRADGTYPVMCRITIDGEPSRFNTKVNVNPNIWEQKPESLSASPMKLLKSMPY